MEESTLELKKPTDYLILALFEAFGTAILTIGMNFGYKVAPDIVSCGLFMAISLTYRITGSHLSGGVTLGVAIVEGAWKDPIKKKAFFAYIIGQIVGAYLGMLIVFLIVGANGTMNLLPEDTSDNIFYTLFIEFIFSWIFLTIYLHAKSDWVAPSQDFGLRAFTIAIVAYACSAMSQPVNGGPLNPTIALATMTFHLMVIPTS